MRELKSLWNDYISLVSFQALAVPASFIFISVITKILGPAEYGRYNVFLSMAQLIFFLGASWTTHAVIRFGKEEYILGNKFNKTFWTRTFIMSMSFIFVFLAVAILRNKILSYMGGNGKDFLILGILVGVMVFSDFLCSFLQVTNRLKMYGFSIFTRQLTLILLSIFLIFKIFKPTYKSIVYFDIFSYILMAAIAALFLKLRYFKPFEIPMKETKKIFFYSWSFIFAISAGYLLNWVDIYVIKAFRGLEDVGIYQLAYRMVFYLGGFLSAGSTVIFPLFVAAEANEKSSYMERFVERVIPQATFFWAIFLSILIFISEYAFKVIFDQKYFLSYKVFNILLMGVSFQVVIALYTTVFAVLKMIPLRTVIIIGMTIIYIVGDFLLVPKIGIYGAAISMVLAYSFGAVGNMIVINRMKKIKNFYLIIFALIPFGAFLANLFLSKSLGIFVLMILVASAFLIAKKKKTFLPSDAEVFDLINMPESAKRVFRKIYSFIS